MRNIKQKLTSWGLFMVALLVVASSLAGALTSVLPEAASAAGQPSGSIVPDVYGTAGSEFNKVIKSNSGAQCKASISGPVHVGNGESMQDSALVQFAAQNDAQQGITAVTNLLSQVSGVDGAAKNTFSDVANDKGVLSINFSYANSSGTGRNSSDDCQNISLFLFRQASASDATTFYGFWNTNLFKDGQLDNAKRTIFIKATVNVTDKTVSFTIPASSGSGWPANSRAGSYTLSLTDGSGLLSNKTYFPGSGGGGSTGGGASNCLIYDSADSNALKKCIASLSEAYFTDAAHITYNGDIYEATGWGNVSNKIVYNLQTAASADRTRTGKSSQIVMDTTQKDRDINMDDSGNLGDINSIGWALKNAVSTTGTVDLTLNNSDIGGNAASATIKAGPLGLATFATYYAKSDSVSLVFAQAGSNEKPYFGTYTRVSGSNKFTLAGSNWGGKCVSLATFDFGKSDPKSPSTHYSGSTLVTDTSMPATWQLDANDNACDIGNIAVTVSLNSTADGPTGGTNSTDTTGDTPEINCSVKLFNPLSWFLCPLATALESIVTQLDNEINNFLDIEPCTGASSSCSLKSDWSAYKQSWAVIRNLALGLVAVFALVAIVSQALGFEIIDAYTIRKVLPRLLIAAIGITLSWPLMVFFINFTDALGFGVRQLIYAPFSGQGAAFQKVEFGGGAQVLTFFAAGGAIVALGFAGLLSFVATAALAVAVAFLVLTLRQMIVVLLVIFAPIAIACFILPNTQKVWKLWHDSFTKALLMFPIIAGFIAIGRVFAAVNSHGAGSVNQIIAFTAYFAPYFLIPFTFRLAGGAVATIGGLVNDRSRGAFDRLKKFRGAKTAENFHNMKEGKRFSDRNALTRGFNTATAATGVGWQGRFGMGTRGAEALDQVRRSAAMNSVMKHPSWATIQENDDVLRAATFNNASDARKGMSDRAVSIENRKRTASGGTAMTAAQEASFRDSQRASIDTAVAGAQASIGFGRPQAIAAAQQLATTGTGYEDMTDQSLTIARASGGNVSSASAMAGYNNFINKQKGRHDLAPGAGNLIGMSTSQAAMSGNEAAVRAQADGQVTNAWNSGSLYNIANGKGAATKKFAEHWTKEYQEALTMQPGDARDARLKRALSAKAEMKAMLPNASGDNQQIINKFLDGIDNPQTGIYTQYAQQQGFTGTAMGPQTAQQAASEQAFMAINAQANREARTYERPDPHNIS